MRNYIHLKLARMHKDLKVAFWLCVDFTLILWSTVFSFYLRLGIVVPTSEISGYFDLYSPTAVSALLSFSIFSYCGLYQSVARLFSLDAALSLGVAWIAYFFIYVTIFSIIGVDLVPRSIGLIQPVILALLLISMRLLVREVVQSISNTKMKFKRRSVALVYGAGGSGRELAQALKRNSKTNVVGFLDDNTVLCYRRIDGIVVYPLEDLEKLKHSKGVEEVFLAMPTVAKKRRTEIIDTLTKFGIAVRSLPRFSDIEQGLITFNKARELPTGDILARDQASPDPDLMRDDILGKVVMVSGAGGSIGSALCEQILLQLPLKLVLFEQNEFALYNITQQLEKINSQNIPIVALLGSVQNKARVYQIFADHKPNTFYHAAACKHLPIVEDNPLQGLETNVFGTMVCASAAQYFSTKKFVLISTDKAVRPTNVMGASKRIAELIVQGIQSHSKTTRYAIVRFGNVLDSSGSVVPKFRQQINEGGPVTVTHKDVTRYFMTILEASQLVIQAGAIVDTICDKKNSDYVPVFVLDMGRPVKIYDLAIRMVTLTGLTVFNSSNLDGDIEIKVVGLRPGEKLYEELLIDGAVMDTSHEKIKLIDEPALGWRVLKKEIRQLELAIEKNETSVMFDVFGRIVTGYRRGIAND
ncbi:MAG: nucleoside-diphosphate sugar epimerase/dehydratase [Paracoccaceae bacterium]